MNADETMGFSLLTDRLTGCNNYKEARNTGIESWFSSDFLHSGLPYQSLPGYFEVSACD